MIKTEMRNPKTTHIDEMSIFEMIDVMCEESINAVNAVKAASESIAKAIEAISLSLKNGGKLFFVGAGTSGRLGIMDAAECPPTFGVEYGRVNGIIAGGYDCIVKASEGAEDNAANGAADIKKSGIKQGDAVVGISVAGGAAYVVSALKTAKELGAVTISLSSNKGSAIERESDIAIITDTGAEVITGSTRLKAGTAHKIVLNILTSCSFVKLGYVYENLMINLKPSNIKLKNRMIGIVCDLCGVERDVSEKLLLKSNWNIRDAVSMQK